MYGYYYDYNLNFTDAHNKIFKFALICRNKRIVFVLIFEIFKFTEKREKFCTQAWNQSFGMAIYLFSMCLNCLQDCNKTVSDVI